jgi:hypothetical protein
MRCKDSILGYNIVLTINENTENTPLICFGPRQPFVRFHTNLDDFGYFFS